MAEYSKKVVGDNVTDLKSFVESNWGLKNIDAPIVLRKNEEREVYFVRSLEASFVLKLFFSEHAKKSIIQYTGVLAFMTQSEFACAPRIIKALSGDYIVYEADCPAYLVEYIEGEELIENEEDEYKLGSVTAKLHGLQGCPIISSIDTSRCVADMLTRFDEYPFKERYDAIVKNLPDFTRLRQSLIHTDISRTNAIRRSDGEICLIDFDDAGIGSTYIDLGYPLITQFVQYVGRKEGGPVPDINKLEFHFTAAKAFYDGYFSVIPMTEDEKRFIFDGAVFMQLFYMPVFGSEAVPYLWKILTFALENKPLLLSALGI